MIILFHCLSILVSKLFQSGEVKLKKSDDSPENTKNGLKHTYEFNPSLRHQRHLFVYDTLVSEQWRTKISRIADLGCGEFDIFSIFKTFRIPNIFFVDIDETILTKSIDRLEPKLCDEVESPNLHTPMEISVFSGNVADHDERLFNMDMVTAIEVIEHLYPDELEAFPYNIFNNMKPKVVLITTPNITYNILFSDDPTKFRHYDHKFEWDIDQFRSWVENICDRFPNYTVRFKRIGDISSSYDGYCTHGATFIREDDRPDPSSSIPCRCDDGAPCKDARRPQPTCRCVCALCSPRASFGICTYQRHSKVTYPWFNEMGDSVNYHLVTQIKYPYVPDGLTDKERLKIHCDKIIRELGKNSALYYDEAWKMCTIPLRELLNGKIQVPMTINELARLLEEFGYTVESCGRNLETCIAYETVMEEVSSSSDASGYDSDSFSDQLNEEPLTPCRRWYIEKPMDQEDIGNNYVAPDEADRYFGYNNFNLEPEAAEPPEFQEANANFDNNNRDDEDLQVLEDPFVVIEERGNVENAENVQVAENLIGEASREVLFDPNSEQDSLDDFEVPAPLHEADNLVNVVSTGNNVIFIGLHPTPEENETGFFEEQHNFPHWLLQILGSQVMVDTDAPTGSQEEPHFYCQGDGLAVENDEEESTESSNNTAEFVDLDQGVSSQDMTSLPEDSQATVLSENHENVPPPTPVATTSEEPEESSSNTDVGAPTKPM